jgi:hypothetical protein
MASNQASMARRQRERARIQQQQEKQAKRLERRNQKKTASAPSDNPMDDPTIDWSGAVRETKLPAIEEPEEPAPDEAQPQ